MIMLTFGEFTELQEENGGVCLACGDFAYGVEPDARNYTCVMCGQEQVFGADEALLMGLIEFKD